MRTRCGRSPGFDEADQRIAHGFDIGEGPAGTSDLTSGEWGEAGGDFPRAERGDHPVQDLREPGVRERRLGASRYANEKFSTSGYAEEEPNGVPQVWDTPARATPVGPVAALALEHVVVVGARENADSHQR